MLKKGRGCEFEAVLIWYLHIFSIWTSSHHKFSNSNPYSASQTTQNYRETYKRTAKLNCYTDLNYSPLSSFTEYWVNVVVMLGYKYEPARLSNKTSDTPTTFRMPITPVKAFENTYLFVSGFS